MPDFALLAAFSLTTLHSLLTIVYPGVGLPYVSTTLQIAPGIRQNRPVAGKDPKGERLLVLLCVCRRRASSRFFHEPLTPHVPIHAIAGKGWNWYKDLLFGAKTKMNMYFYGTLLDKTQKDEPAGRSIHQVGR